MNKVNGENDEMCCQNKFVLISFRATSWSRPIHTQDRIPRRRPSVSVLQPPVSHTNSTIATAIHCIADCGNSTGAVANTTAQQHQSLTQNAPFVASNSPVDDRDFISSKLEVHRAVRNLASKVVFVATLLLYFDVILLTLTLSYS